MPVSAFSVIVAISAGLLVLLGYFLPGLDLIRDVLLKWAIILAAFALLVGVLNLLSVHWGKISANKPEGVYSAVMIFFFLLTVLVVGVNGPTGDWSLWIINYIQVPLETSLLAILAVTLVYASTRLLRRRPNWTTFIFIAAVVLVLLGTVPVYGAGELPLLSEFRSWLARVPAIAGARGILLGVALGSIAAGIRILMGADRPYGG